MQSKTLNDDWRSPAGSDRYHTEVEHFRRRQQDKLASDINHALIGRNAAIVVVALLLLLGMSTLITAVGSALTELADLQVTTRSSMGESSIILVGLAVGGAMVFAAMFCIVAISRLFRYFQHAYSETADIMDRGIQLGRTGKVDE
jgi:small-conductance mechanosensitive channel